METNFAAFTLFIFFLFAVSTARIFDTDLAIVHTTQDASKTITSLPDSNILLPTDPSKSDSNHQGKDRMFRLDLTPRSEFARFHAINRHFFDEPRVPLRLDHRRPYRHFQANGNEDVDAHHRAPWKQTKSKHDYGHRRHRYHHHLHHGSSEGSVPKHMDHETVKSLMRQHKREHEAGLMKSIRKFLKHTFD